MTRTLISAGLIALSLTAPAFAQDDTEPFAFGAPAGPAHPDGMTLETTPAPALGFEPMLLEVGPGETVSLPQTYQHRACSEETMASLFQGGVDSDFLATLRCYRVPVEHSGAFAQTLDQAIVAAGWTYDDEAGQIVHYRRGEEGLDVRVFWLGEYSDEETQDRGFLFGVYDAG